MTVPENIAIIMDGNGRWATSKGKFRVEGHKKGVETVEKILEHSIKLGIKTLTVYAFSTENWKRPKLEVKALMDLFMKYLKTKKDKMNENGVKLLVTGSREGLSQKLIDEIDKTEEFLKNNDKIIFNIAFNYGGRLEIVHAFENIMKKGIKEINEKTISDNLYRPEIKDPELVIRTSGEFRISNFLLWQIAYSEFYITDVYWPDFDEKELEKAILSYNNRDRRYGGIKDDVD